MKKHMGIDINKYDYLMFVDASGDDGIKFDTGSSSCYAVAGYLVRREDLGDDIQLLRNIRGIISGQPARELKYSTLRRHKNRKYAFPLFAELHGQVFGRVSFKKILVSRGTFSTEAKEFSVVSHAVAISLLNNCADVEGKKVLIVVDRMKNTEERPVQMLADSSMHDDMGRLAGYDLIFRDSKDADFQLIQVADFFAGILREYFERYETDPMMRRFWNKCPICSKNTRLILCGRSGSKDRASLNGSSNIRYLRPLFHARNNLDIIDHLYLDPPDLFGNLFYLYCPKI